MRSRLVSVFSPCNHRAGHAASFIVNVNYICRFLYFGKWNMRQFGRHLQPRRL